MARPMTSGSLRPPGTTAALVGAATSGCIAAMVGRIASMVGRIASMVGRIASMVVLDAMAGFIAPVVSWVFSAGFFLQPQAPSTSEAHTAKVHILFIVILLVGTTLVGTTLGRTAISGSYCFSQAAVKGWPRAASLGYP